MNPVTPMPCPNHPPGAEAVNQIFQPIQMPHMTNAEQLGVRSAYEEFQRVAVPQYGQIAVPFNDPQRLRIAILWALREIDSVQAFGLNLAGILQSEQYMRRIAAVAYRGAMGQNNVALENQPFDVNLFFMNLTGFLIRFLNR
jgi:hypothetical protein